MAGEAAAETVAGATLYTMGTFSGRGNMEAMKREVQRYSDNSCNVFVTLLLDEYKKNKKKKDLCRKPSTELDREQAAKPDSRKEHKRTHQASH